MPKTEERETPPTPATPTPAHDALLRAVRYLPTPVDSEFAAALMDVSREVGNMLAELTRLRAEASRLREASEAKQLARLNEIRGTHSWEELAQACRDVLWHGSEGTERLWGSSVISTAASIFGELAKRNQAVPVGQPCEFNCGGTLMRYDRGFIGCDTCGAVWSKPGDVVTDASRSALASSPTETPT